MEVHPSLRADVVYETTLKSSQTIPIETFIDSYGNVSRRLTADAGALALQLEGVVLDSGRPSTCARCMNIPARFLQRLPRRYRRPRLRWISTPGSKLTSEVDGSRSTRVIMSRRSAESYLRRVARERQARGLSWA
jgi:hypothetical protein